LLFGFATFPCVCFGVARELFFTRGTWLHAEAAAVWVWWHVSAVFFPIRINEQKQSRIGGKKVS
jgi:Mlc titration factor MtfA (ptsG expression regulator)